MTNRFIVQPLLARPQKAAKRSVLRDPVTRSQGTKPMDRLMIRWLSPVPLKLAAALAAVGGVSACAALSQAPIRTGQAQMADVQTPRQPLAAIGADTAAAAPAPDRFWSTPASPTAGHKPARSGDKTYRAEFRDADLKDFARTILGDLLGEAYVIDPNVQGPVAAASAGKLTRAELLNLLEAAAQQNNAALTRVGGVWRLTPQDSPNRGARLLRPDEAGFGVSSFPLRNITPARAQALLEAMLPRAGAVKTDANSVIVSGTGAERAAVAEALAALDSSWLAGLFGGPLPAAERRRRRPGRRAAQSRRSRRRGQGPDHRTDRAHQWFAGGGARRSGRSIGRGLDPPA
jgi:hypothetical protein